MQPPRQLATWNPDRDLWETDQLSIFGPLVAYSETLPRSGMTRDGRLYEHLTLAHPTTARGFSSSPSLPTLVAQPSGNTPENHLRKKPGCKVVTDLAILVENGLLETGGKMLPTPRASDPANASSHSSPGFRPQLGEVARALEVQLLPTPKACDSPAMSAVSHHFPTPAASDATGGGANPANREGRTGQIIDAVLDADLWGKYGPAIARWEKVVGPAPAPTEPSRSGRPRLAAQFAEWMMGLPVEHVTNPTIGLSRIGQLKAIGNGVCPQQALAALAILDPRQAA